MISTAREISWKAILAGLGVSLVIGLLLSVVYVQLISWSTGQLLLSETFSEATSVEVIARRGQELMESARWIPGWLVITFATHFVAGYVAANYARRREVVHGVIIGVTVGAAVFNIVYTPVIITAAVLGSMLRKRRKYAGI